jgi:hypothetical protein
MVLGLAGSRVIFAMASVVAFSCTRFTYVMSSLMVIKASRLELLPVLLGDQPGVQCDVKLHGAAVTVPPGVTLLSSKGLAVVLKCVPAPQGLRLAVADMSMAFDAVDAFLCPESGAFLRRPSQPEYLHPWGPYARLCVLFPRLFEVDVKHLRLLVGVQGEPQQIEVTSGVRFQFERTTDNAEELHGRFSMRLSGGGSQYKGTATERSGVFLDAPSVRVCRRCCCVCGIFAPGGGFDTHCVCVCVCVCVRVCVRVCVCWGFRRMSTSSCRGYPAVSTCPLQCIPRYICEWITRTSRYK